MSPSKSSIHKPIDGKEYYSVLVVGLTHITEEAG